MELFVCDQIWPGHWRFDLARSDGVGNVGTDVGRGLNDVANSENECKGDGGGREERYMAYKTGEDVDLYLDGVFKQSRSWVHQLFPNYFTVRREAGRCGPCDLGRGP